MFAFKKLVSVFLFPVASLSFCLAAGLVLLWWKDRPQWNRWGKRLVTGAVVLFWVLGSSWCGDLALRPLLQRYPMLDVSALRASRGADWAPDYLVVLAAGHHPHSGVPPSLRLGNRSLARVNLAYQLHREFPQTPIICTGGSLSHGLEPVSRDMVALLQGWGVSETLLIAEEESRDTDDHVRYLRERLNGKNFLLITSATHMPRSMALFRHAGLNPLPAPEPDFDLGGRGFGRHWWRGLIPSGGNLERIESAAYEYMGLLWAKLCGLI